uniref:Uncharacterized protein n=1 Tax=Digenea simplex TaxID=945030 RepID=A0A1Z1MTY7_DIGSM|nr:hypothetical protein [Digenea simplex]ARW69558.1 hypothetical protein [Digenea simplex]
MYVFIILKNLHFFNLFYRLLRIFIHMFIDLIVIMKAIILI